MSNPNTWRVLVIEDEADSSEVVKEIFEAQNVPCWTAASAEEALDLLGEVNPNLLIVDLALPGMDGWAFLREVQNNAATAHIPAVAVTAFHSANVARQAIEAGFKAYFPKPLDTMSFVRELARIIN